MIRGVAEDEWVSQREKLNTCASFQNEVALAQARGHFTDRGWDVGIFCCMQAMHEDPKFRKRAR